MSRKDNLEKLITEHQRRLQKLKEKEARFGINSPPEILMEVEDIQARIERLQAELKAIEDAGGHGDAIPQRRMPTALQRDFSSLPAVRKSAPLTTSRGVHEKSQRAFIGRPHILIADDQPNWREIFSELLEDEYEVTSVGNYAEAMEALLAQDPPFHVAVVDIRLDDKDQANEEGLDLIAELNKMGKHTNTMVVTGYPSLRTVKKALQDLAAFEYVEKYPADGTAFDHLRFRRKVNEAVDDAEKRRQLFVFVLMPFAPEYNDIYHHIVKKTVKNYGLLCIRADDLYEPRRVIDDIKECIREATFIVADLSGRNPNVFYEIGMAHAIGQTVLLLTQNMVDVPPKLRDVRCMLYQDSLEGAKKLEKALTKAIQGLQENGYRSAVPFKRKDYEPDARLCFVLPASIESAQNAYDHIVREVVEGFGLTCVNAQSVFSIGHVMDEIWEHLNRARIVVADLSGRDPDVFYLTGISHGLKKDVILLAQSQEDVPFDLRGPSHIVYSVQTFQEGIKAKEDLASVLRKFLDNDRPHTRGVATSSAIEGGDV